MSKTDFSEYMQTIGYKQDIAYYLYEGKNDKMPHVVKVYNQLNGKIYLECDGIVCVYNDLNDFKTSFQHDFSERQTLKEKPYNRECLSTFRPLMWLYPHMNLEKLPFEN